MDELTTKQEPWWFTDHTHTCWTGDQSPCRGSNSHRSRPVVVQIHTEVALSWFTSLPTSQVPGYRFNSPSRGSNSTPTAASVTLPVHRRKCHSTGSPPKRYPWIQQGEILETETFLDRPKLSKSKRYPVTNKAEYSSQNATHGYNKRKTLQTMLFHVISDTFYTQNVTLPNKGISHPKTAAPWYMTSLLLFGFYDLKALVGIGSMCYFRKGVCCSSSNSGVSIRCLIYISLRV